MWDLCPSLNTDGDNILYSLAEKVYYSARDGRHITLLRLLNNQPPELREKVLRFVIVDDGQKSPPLVIAAKNGHEKVVSALLDTFNLNIEQEGTVKFDGYVIEGASALWCAAGAGHLSVVKFLVEHGANVNHPTSTNSTPIRAACFDGRLDIVRYLFDNRADIHIANKYNNTCLMIACYKGHLDVVRFLLEHGSDSNVKAHCGATALHFSCECGHLEIVKELLRYGTQMEINDHGMTPLISASESSQAEVVEYLTSLPQCSTIERIEALELLGASFANDKDKYNLEKAFYYIYKGMLERHNGPEIIKKPWTLPVSAYENRIECQTPEELVMIQNNHNALHMEALVIRERILGSNNPEVPHPVIFRGAVFADHNKFDSCISLWMHALKLRHSNRRSISKDLLRFAQVFSQMIHVCVEFPFQILLEVIQYAVWELERNKLRLKLNLNSTEQVAAQDELDANIHNMLYLLIISTKLLKKCTQEEELQLCRLTYKFTRLDLRLKDNSTPLHLVVNADTPVDDFHTNDVCRFPCAETTKLLIKCGSDVNALDNQNCSSLHIIVGYHRPISDFLTLYAIIIALIEAGSHMDQTNLDGETPYDAAATGVAEIILRTQTKLSLKCLAAKAINQYNLPYQGQVPQNLEEFIEIHGVPQQDYI